MSKVEILTKAILVELENANNGVNYNVLKKTLLSNIPDLPEEVINIQLQNLYNQDYVTSDTKFAVNGDIFFRDSIYITQNGNL